MGRTTHRILAAVACAACVACTDQGPDPPTPGTVDVMLTTPNAQDRAVLMTLVGEVQTFTPAPGVALLEHRSAATVTLLFVADDVLSPGDNRLGSFAVADTSRIGSITAALTEVAGADYSLSADLTAYRVRLARR